MTAESPAGLISHKDTFRHSVPIRVGAYWVLCGGCGLFWSIGVYPFPIGFILTVTLVETIGLTLVHRHAVTSRRWAAAYLVFEGCCQTLIFYVSGDLRIAFAPIVYTFELLNPGMRLDRRGHFLVANGFVTLFAIVIIAEASGWMPVVEAPELMMSQAVRTSTVVIMFLCLNVAALFISAAREMLEARSVALEFARKGLVEHSNQLEERVRRRTVELERSYRALEATTSELRTFIYNVTHDLKNPFNAIVLTTDLLIERCGSQLREEIRRDLLEMSQTARHGEAMLRDLLDVFRITSLDEARERVDMAALVSTALAVLRPQIKDRNVDVVVGALPAVWGQPRKLGHVMMNLLSNAVRHAPRGSGLVDISGVMQHPHVVLRVRDNGPGVSPEYHQRIFELFGRVPTFGEEGDASAGTGVGLALVKRIVEEHDGDVWVESQLGSGASFVLRLLADSEAGIATGPREEIFTLATRVPDRGVS
jgi:signal transduction histidine kinase